MDILETQICDDNDITSTQEISHLLQQDKTSRVQVGVLNVGSNVYPVKQGINKIGRHPECHIVLNDQTVSKKHAEIEANSHETSAWICDLNSSNKTKLNNSVLRSGRCYELRDGSMLEFGMVRAVYKVCSSADDSLIPETPLPNRQKNRQPVIPGTPDSSAELNNSSTAGDNVSMIPGTQTNDEEPTFRRPSVPQRSSSNKKNLVHDSFIDSSLDSSRSFTVGDKENVGKQKVSIHDMETQKTFESLNETEVDIHDVETQKICLDEIRIAAKLPQNQTCDIHDMETQHEETENTTTDSHDTNLQYDVNIHEMETPKRICAQSTAAWDADDNTRDENPETTRQESIEEDKSTICNIDVPKIEIKLKDMSCLKDADEDKNCTVPSELDEDMRKNSDEYLQLSVATNFEEDISELDMSRNLLGSQNLLDHIIDDNEPPDQTKSKSPTPVKSTSVNDVEESNDKSTDDENIHEAATQVKIHDENPCKDAFKTSQAADDSDVSNQGVFQSYSYVRRKDNEKSSQDRCSGSDDSDTDEEGHFAKIALQERQNLSSSFDKRPSDVSEVKSNRSSSKESEDMFDMLTQNVNSKNKNSLVEMNDDNSGKDDEDFDAPTQVIQTERSNADVETKEIDAMPTQIMSTIESIMKEVPSASLTEHTETTVEGDVSEMDDDIATQLITVSEKNSDNTHDKSPSPSNQLDTDLVEECSVEDIDYETAPTQLISEVERKESTGKKRASRKSKEPNQGNLNDTLERNLNEMFDDVNEESIEDEQQISTQLLKNMLQSSQSQCEDELRSENSKPNDDASTKVRKSPRSGKSKPVVVDSVPELATDEKSRLSNLKDTNIDSDSQNTESYFSALTSMRKRNVLIDSENLADPSEHTPTDKTIKTHTAVSETVITADDKDSVRSPSRSKPKSSSTPMPTRKTKYEEPKVVEEEIVDPKNVENLTIETPENDLTSDTPNNTEEHRYSYGILDNDDEDIMAGLPEVRISGTLSNPPSPTTPTSGIRKTNTNGTRAKKGSGNVASKKKGGTSKSSRKTLISHKNTENDAPYRCISKSDSSSRLESLSEPLPANVDVDLSSTEMVEKVNKNSKRSTRNTITDSSSKSKEGDSLDERKSTPSVNHLQEQARQSPFVQSNGRTRSSSKKNVDQSSVFQVEKEALIENVTEPVKPNVSLSRLGKRSLSVTDAIESNDAKKRREDIEESTRKSTKGRKSNARNTTAKRRYSANIMNFVTKTSSPLNIKDSNSSKLPLDESNLINKQAVINIVRLSPCDSIGSSSPRSAVETVAKNIADVTKQTQLDQSSMAKDKKPPSNAEPLRTRRASSRHEAAAEEDVSSQGEESQEVEMIMNNSILERTNNLDTDTKKDEDNSKRDVRTRNTRKRVNTNKDKEPEESSVSSDICESNDGYFEVPTSRSKRAKLSKNTSNLLSSTIKEEPVARTRSSRQSSRSAQAQSQVISESSAEEHSESSVDQSSSDTTASKGNTSKKRGQRTKVQKLEADKKQNKQIRDNSVSSETNSSIDAASITSTPNRTRGSISSLTSPFKIKHKILFTGVSSNDYSKMLTKLGASQVEDPTKCTVLVTDKVRRTVKFLCALAQSIPIVSIDWLVESGKTGHFVELENYILKDPAAEAKFGFKLRGSLEKAKEHKLLEGYSIVLTPNVAPPPLPELKSIIVSCGGKALVRPPPSWPQKAVIISREEDLANAKKFLAKAPKTVTVQSTEFILTGILKQELDFVKYKLT